MDSHKSVGNWGEDLAVKLLKRKGYKILIRNFHSKYGEIDIIARDKKTLVFVEVKLRTSGKFGRPEEAVTPAKLEKIKTTGYLFAQQNNLNKVKMRVDVVAIQKRKDSISYKIIKVI